MRTAKSLWSLSGFVGFIVGLAIALHESAVMAQLPAPNPLVAPLSTPSGPALLPAPGAALAAPSLAAVPTLPAASPTPGPRAFNCSCFGPGEGTGWMGQVSAPGYFAARQTATGACLTYNERREPAPANVAPAEGEVPVMPPGFAGPNAAASVNATPLPGGLTISSAAQEQACAQCVCD